MPSYNRAKTERIQLEQEGRAKGYISLNVFYEPPRPQFVITNPQSLQTDERSRCKLERLHAENETLKKRSEKGLALKVSQKGGVSVYGLGRFPVTLYKEQWEKLLDMKDDILSFIQENEAQLKTKES